MIFKNISDKELDEYVLHSNKSHFMQTSAWGEVAKTRGYVPHLLGLFDDDKIVGTALLLEKKILSYSTFYCPRGFIVDFNDKVLVKEMIDSLKKYAGRNNGLYIKINPDIVIRKLDEEAKPKETFDDNLALIDFFKENGATFRGFTTKFSESSAPRFTFRVDISKDKEEIYNSLHNTTKKIIKENNPYGIIISKNADDALNDFYKVMKETSIRKKMYIEPLSYFENFYNKLKEKDEADIYVASVDIKKLKEAFREKLNAVDSEIDDVSKRPDGPKKENKLKDLEQKRNKVIKLKNEVDELTEERIVLSSIITAKFADKVWTIHGGNSDRLSFLNANYELYYHILLDSKENGFSIVDFYGSEGTIDKNSSAYGIFLFKLRFGGDFDEFVGEFDFVIRPYMNKIINSLLIYRRKIKYRKSVKEKK